MIFSLFNLIHILVILSGFTISNYYIVNSSDNKVLVIFLDIVNTL